MLSRMGQQGKSMPGLRLEHLVAISNDAQCKNSNNKKKKRKEVILEIKPLREINLTV